MAWLNIHGRLSGMRGSIVLCLLLSSARVMCPATDAGPTAVAQKLFDAMAAHDGAGARALFTADAYLIAVAPDGKVTVTPVEKWTDRLSSSKDNWLERMWSPKLQEHNAIATIWGEYDFHLNGKFTHCGIDTFTLVKTNGEWRIAALVFTRETSGCPESPLGPPKG
jgi:Domain of unknown function (DUF4440)